MILKPIVCYQSLIQRKSTINKSTSIKKKKRLVHPKNNNNNKMTNIGVRCIQSRCPSH